MHPPVSCLRVADGDEGRFPGRAEVALTFEDGVDLAAAAPPDAGLTEWPHAADGEAGRRAVVHPSRRVALGLEHDPDVVRTTWTWGVDGGWRGHYFVGGVQVLLTEPATSPPGGLGRAAAEGTAAVLAPGATLETHVRATVIEQVDPSLPAAVAPVRLDGASAAQRRANAAGRTGPVVGRGSGAGTGR